MKEAEQARIWRVFAKEHAAPWLANGPFVKPLRGVHRELYRQKKWAQAGGLVAAVSGTAWTQFERWHLGLYNDPRCQLCLRADGTMQHRICECTATAQLRGPEEIRLAGRKGT